MRVRELAEWLEAAYEGNGEAEITGVADLDTAGPKEIAFAKGRKAVARAQSCEAGCLLVTPDFDNSGKRLVIRVADPRAACARVIGLLHPQPKPEPGIHAAAVVATDAVLGDGVAVGACSVIGEGARIGTGTSIGTGCSIGKGAVIGEGCVLNSSVSIYDGVKIGDRVIIHSGAVIGADGFGFVMTGERYEKFPQVGRVEIGNDVEIGANSCVDRAALGVTSIGDGTKLDNLVQVGHNCRIGKHVVVAAQTGFSGGVVVDDYAVIGGQVGIGDKVHIESRAVLGSGCGVLTSKIVRSGEVVWGTPARPLKEHLSQLANLSRLPQLRKEMTELERRIASLEAM